MNENIDMTARNKENPSVFMFVVFGIILLITCVLIGLYVVKSGKIKSFSFKKEKAPTVSSDILFLTQPIMSFSGKIEKIEGNAIFVSQKLSRQQPIDIPSNFSSDETPESVPVVINKIVAYKVIVTDETKITCPSLNIPYLFNKNQEEIKKFSISDLKPGNKVDINTSTDLRTITNGQFEANAVQVRIVFNSLRGKINKIENNKIYLKAVPPIEPELATTVNQISPTPEEKEYFIVVSPKTEISSYLVSINNINPRPQKHSLSDLKENMQITVYTDVDVAVNQQFTALRIEPVIEIPAPTPVAE